MSMRELGALLLVLLTACAGTPRVAPPPVDPDVAELAAAHYELHVLTADTSSGEPVKVSPEEFQRAMRMLAPDIPLTEQPMETAQWLMEGALQADLLAEVERDQVVRLMPLADNSPLEASSAAEMKRKYLTLCQQEYSGGDCLGLMTDGPILTRHDLRTLGLALSLKGVLRETRVALQDMVSVQALVALVVWTGCFYLLLWMLPEPASKLLAAGLTLALLAWLPVHTVWSLMDGWAALVHEVDRATSYEQIEEASERFSRVMGENTAHVLVMVLTAAVAGGGKFVAKLPKLPGFSRAAARAEAQGVTLAEAGEVEVVAAGEEGTFTLMVRRPGSRAAAAAEEAVETRAGVTIIRHRGGNQQVFIDGKRWHLRAGQSIREIPVRDPVGDQLQEAAVQAARRWNPEMLSAAEQRAIDLARARGQYIKARLMERMFRGKFVEQTLRDQFKNLRWYAKGVDAVDPVTGYKYEILSGTKSNLELHGRRMAEEFFRMIAF